MIEVLGNGRNKKGQAKAETNPFVSELDEKDKKNPFESNAENTEETLDETPLDFSEGVDEVIDEPVVEDPAEGADIVEPIEIRNAVVSKKKKKKANPDFEKPKPKLDTKKKKIIIISAVVIVLLGAIIFAVTRDKSNYFTLFKEAVISDGGAFKYTITVNTPLEQTESNKETTESGDKGKHDQSINDEWLDSTNAKIPEWNSPNYTLIVSGQTFSLDPYEAYYLFELKTQYVNAPLLEIYSKDGYYYLDLSYLYDTLNSSQDMYLMSLAERIETQRGIIKVAKENFKFSSLFSDEAKQTDLYAAKEQLCDIISMLLTEIQNNSDGVTKVDDNSFTLKVSDASGVVKRLKALAQNSGDVYKSIYKDASAKEIANVLNAFSDVNTYFQVDNDMKLSLEGQAVKYVSGTGKDVYECVLNTTSVINDKKYKINITCTRSSEQLKIDTAKFASSIEVEDTAFLDSLFKSLVNYLNPTSINTYNNDTTNTFDNISENIRLAFIDMVNETGLVKVYRSTLDDFLKDYLKYDDEQGTLKKLVTTYNTLFNLEAEIDDGSTNKNTLSTVTSSGLTISIEHVPLSDVKYTKFNIKVSGITDKALKLTDITIKDKHDNIYPANNSVLLAGVLNEEIVTEITEDGEYSLYFLMENLRDLQVFYNTENLGTIDIR